MIEKAQAMWTVEPLKAISSTVRRSRFASKVSMLVSDPSTGTPPRHRDPVPLPHSLDAFLEPDHWPPARQVRGPFDARLPAVGFIRPGGVSAVFRRQPATAGDDGLDHIPDGVLS